MRQIGGSRDEIGRMMWDELADEYAEALRLREWNA